MNFIFKRWFFFIILATLNTLALRSAVFAKQKYKPAIVALLDAGPSHPHQKKITQLFQQQWKKCPECKLISFPIYNSEGIATPELFLKALEKAASSAQIIHLSWNLEYTEIWNPVLTQFEELHKKGIRVVAASGAGEGAAPGKALNTTVMGKAKGVYLIGEVGPKGRLPGDAYYGEEMFTAFPSPKGWPGSSFSSVQFTSSWAVIFNSKKPEEWDLFLKEKSKYRLILWPSVEYFFK